MRPSCARRRTSPSAQLCIPASAVASAQRTARPTKHCSPILTSSPPITASHNARTPLAESTPIALAKSIPVPTPIKPHASHKFIPTSSPSACQPAPKNYPLTGKHLNVFRALFRPAFPCNPQDPPCPSMHAARARTYKSPSCGLSTMSSTTVRRPSLYTS
jgi:hypothetical protein